MSSDKGNCNDFSRDVNKQLTGSKQTNLLRLNHDSMTSDDLDGDDEDRLVIADEDAEAIAGLFIFFVYIFVYTSALKLEKKCNFKSAKSIICIFKNGKKLIFAPEKKFKTTKNAILTFFLVQKLIFLPFLKLQKLCFCAFEIALFSNFRAL